MKDFWLNDLIDINHPYANRMSVQDSPSHYAGKNTSEVAFFVNQKFQTRVIPEFAKYADGEAGGTLVYGWVPNELIENFLDTYRA